MKKYILFLLLFPMLSNAGDLCQGRATVVVLDQLYYDPGNVGMLQSPLISEATAVPSSSMKCTLFKGIGTAGTATTALATAALTLTPLGGGSNDLYRAGQADSHTWCLELTATDTALLGGLAVEVVYAGRLVMSNSWEVVSPEYYDARYGAAQGIAGRLQDVTVAIDAGRADIAGRVEEASKLIIASGNVISSSGITLPEDFARMEGDVTKNLLFNGVSLSSATPDFRFSLTSLPSTENLLWATESACSYSAYQRHDGNYVHRWSYPITGNLPRGWYSGMITVHKEGQWIGKSFRLILDTTPEVDTTDLPTKDWLAANLIHPASQSFKALRGGYAFDGMAGYSTVTEVVRSQTGQSTVTSRYVPEESLYGIELWYTDPFGGVKERITKLFDYDEYTNKINAFFDAPVSATASAAIDDVTLTTSGRKVVPTP